ncbi:hypothetical protein L195_g063538, partial [Trifolium pratense]
RALEARKLKIDRVIEALKAEDGSEDGSEDVMEDSDESSSI